MKLQSKVLQVATVCALAVGGVTAAPQAATAVGTGPHSDLRADEPPVSEQYHPRSVGTGQNPNENLVVDFLITIEDANGNPAAEGTVLSLQTSSCGAPVAGATQTVARVEGGTGSGVFLIYNKAQQAKIGRNIEYSLTITQPGYDPYTFSGSYSGYGVKRPSCEEISNPLIPKWSKKQASQTVVGRTVSVTPTTAPGSTVTYEWKVAAYGRIVGKTVSTTRSLRLKSSWVGRKVGVVIKVKKPNYQQQSRTIVFPKVRRK